MFDMKISAFGDDGGACNQADAGGFIKPNALRVLIAGNLAKARRKSDLPAAVRSGGKPAGLA